MGKQLLDQCGIPLCKVIVKDFFILRAKPHASESIAQVADLCPLLIQRQKNMAHYMIKVGREGDCCPTVVQSCIYPHIPKPIFTNLFQDAICWPPTHGNQTLLPQRLAYSFMLNLDAIYCPFVFLLDWCYSLRTIKVSWSELHFRSTKCITKCKSDQHTFPLRALVDAKGQCTLINKKNHS